MNDSQETAYQRAVAYGLLLDSDVIRRRVVGGDTSFAQRILLTALIKGDEEARAHILENVGAQHFFLPVFDLLFVWVSQALIAKGQIEEDELYQKMEGYVRERWISASDATADEFHHSAEAVMPGYLAPIDHVLAIEMPDEQTIDKAISSLHRLYNWRLAQKKRTDAQEEDTAS